MTAEIKFIVDFMLGRLARWLRILGYDTLYRNNYLPEEIALLSLQEKRVILTRNSRLSPKKCWQIYYLKSDNYQEQLRTVIRHFGLRYSPPQMFKRCSICNSLLEPINKSDYYEEIPDYIYRTHSEFYRCHNCQQIYWPGSHIEFIKNILGQLARESQ